MHQNTVTLSRFKNAPLITIQISQWKNYVYSILKQPTRKGFIDAYPMQKWLRSDNKQKRYLMQKCDTHQIRIRIARGHFQSKIFAKSSFRKGSFSVIWKARTGLLISAFLNSWSLLVTWWQNFAKRDFMSLFFKSYCDHGCFWAKYLSNHFFNNFVVYKNVSVVYFHTNFFSISTSWHWHKHWCHYSKGSAMYL